MIRCSSLHVFLVSLLCLGHGGFSFVHQTAAPIIRSTNTVVNRALLFASASTASSPDAVIAPQVVATGYSSDDDLPKAIREATAMAMESLPSNDDNDDNDATPTMIDLAVIFVSSLYDGTFSPSLVVPSLLDAASSYGGVIQHVIGSTAGGVVGSVANTAAQAQKAKSNCRPAELEGTLGVSVCLFQLPGVELQTFHVLGDDVPDDYARFPASMWKQAVGLTGFGGTDDDEQDDDDDSPVFMLLPSPGFQNDLDDLLQGIQANFPHSSTFGALASTVSSLSRARLFRYDVTDKQNMQTLGDGCVGIAMKGDIQIRTMVAQGAKPVGGIYQVIKATGSTINAIVLDETATELEREARAEDDELEDDEEEEEEDEEATDDDSKKAQMAAAYAKASIPKPCLAEANFLMRTLSDDDQSFMRKALLVGLERGGSVGRTPSELARLREGQGHRFEVKQVASAGMKDGSITLPLGSVNVEPGTRMRFFVRESNFAKKEVEALWMGYKKRVLQESFQTQNDDDDDDNNKTPTSFRPTGCFVLPTLDRGSKFFLGKPGFESGTVTSFVPEISAISGFFSNGVIMKLDEDDPAEIASSTHGSASGFVLFGSKSGRPIYSPAAAAAAKAKAEEDRKIAEEAARAVAEEDEKRKIRTKTVETLGGKAPRSEDGELILKRREVHSGRALTVSTVEWSVAEKQATPSSTLESFMWDKETEVDRFRERVPLANLVSQCRLAASDPTKPKPRDWVGLIRQASKDGFVVIPECKRMEPTSGSLWKRYDAEKLAKQFTLSGAPAICVNCDAVLFGGSQDDITRARKSASSAAVEKASGDDGVVVPPILASDLVLYPYQLYKLSLAGADAVNLVGGALASKDLLYLTKIASSLQLQTLITVTSEVQLRALAAMAPNSIDGIIASNRELEDFSFDMSGEQALRLLQSEALTEVRGKHGDDIPVLVEGRVGVIERVDADGNTSTAQYLQELRDAGATGVIIGGGLAEGNDYAAIREVAGALA
ncbi:Indole-3-glycerol phosphate synthase [Seminavis robusta]|uniref:indole-3-glycerol-phosphate synthase n=1 Tax=Seminavis robusta TaxID=568900 RepID=A0A9N8H431_9STRA|nr:Indole-3-glycerol phosphate synthase [Seminavis robusta]|eukprot:Sro52_g030950.1 Indole-3-glycerol phosphate synthase (1002) ;mRNA; r:52998-56184